MVCKCLWAEADGLRFKRGECCLLWHTRQLAVGTATQRGVPRSTMQSMMGAWLMHRHCDSPPHSQWRPFVSDRKANPKHCCKDRGRMKCQRSTRNFQSRTSNDPPQKSQRPSQTSGGEPESQGDSQDIAHGTTRRGWLLGIASGSARVITGASQHMHACMHACMTWSGRLPPHAAHQVTEHL